MKILLDRNFILSCVKQKIDFLEELFFLGYGILIPKQVFLELDNISKSKQKHYFRNNAALALKILKNAEGSFDDVNLKDNNVDRGIEKFAKLNKGVIIATLDEELKKKIPNKKLVIRGKKKLEII